MLKSFAALATGLAMALPMALNPTEAQAHFQLIHTPEVNPSKPGDLPLGLIFWHPFENGHAMDMGPVLELYAVHRGKAIDLTDSLEPMAFQGASNQAAAFRATLPVRRSGDYVLVAVPTPYLEPSEDIYIQQITKAYVNLNELPTDWAEPQGLKTEIRPLNKPTNILVGSTFTGQVLREGQPVPGVEVEVEYMSAEPLPGEDRAGPPTASPPPGGAVVALTDDDGYFTFGVPKAGFWGFAALGSGPETEYNGKALSQDAVLWIRAHDMSQ